MKKMNYIFNLIAGAALLLSAYACSQEEIDAPASDKPAAKTEFRLGIADTKTSLGESEEGRRKVYWSSGDKVAINGIASDELSEVGEAVSSAVFTFDEAPVAPFNVIYPAGIYKDASTVTLPAYQTWKQGTFDDGMFPMVGYSATGLDATMGYLCSTIKISILKDNGATPDEDNIRVVSFEGLGGERISGDFTIDYEAGTLTPVASPTAEEQKVSVALNKSLSTDTALDVFLVVPAMNYASGFQITVQDSQGHIMTKTGNTTNGKELEAGKLYTLPEFRFIPSGEATGIEIWTAEDLIAFATRYNSGEFELIESGCVASVMDNLVFDATTSASLNAIGGIGTGDDGTSHTNFFNGIFNGNNHTISGLTATAPIFLYSGSGGTIRDLTIDSSCTFTVNSSSTGNNGILVGYNKGKLNNCSSSASVTINNTQEISTTNQRYGGLVGRNHGGTIDGCTMTGDIVCSQSQTITAEDPDNPNAAYIGGIVGTQTNSGKINDCSFTGNISIHDGSQYGAITAGGLYFYVAGIVGYADNGIISDCVAGVDGSSRAIDVRGTFVPAVGGIIGWSKTAVNSEISNCHNYMALSASSNGARADTTPLRIGGIAARAAALIKDCTNSGAIASVSNSTTAELGGIVADGVNVKDCTNNAGGTIIRTNAGASTGQTNRYMYIGGIMGTPNASGDIIGCTNHAVITSNPLGTSSSTTIDIGGILGGGNKFQMDISGCVNDGEVKLDNDNASSATTARKGIGGIFGNVSSDGTTVTECSNSGKVWCYNNEAGIGSTISIGGIIGHTAASSSVTDCTNSGEILCQNLGGNINAYADLGGIVGCAEAAITITGTSADATLNSGTVTVAQASSAIVYARNTQGGILGYGNGNNTKITNCKNTAQIFCNLTGILANNRPSYTGGIVGILANLTYSSNAASGLSALSGVEIGNCSNIGKVNSTNYSNKAGNKNSPFAGGLAGLISGKSDSMASIHDCSVGTQDVYTYRGTTGGIIAYANACTLSNNTCSANMGGTNASVNGVGGIAGRLFDGVMTGCTFSGKIAKAKNIGGLVYTLSEQTTGSTITDCNVSGATLTTGTASDKTAAAVLVSITDDKTNTITDCGVKGTLDGAAITLSSNMITTDGGATVTGTYLLP